MLCRAILEVSDPGPQASICGGSGEAEGSAHAGTPRVQVQTQEEEGGEEDEEGR